jgi:riboflavin biosynthesis pyrimidine reductase
MTTGFVLIFLGAQLALVDSYLLTPRISNFLSENGRAVSAPTIPAVVQANQNSPFSQAGYQQPVIAPTLIATSVPQRTITPPKWLCWPMLFCGTVVFLHGLSMSRN